MVDRGKVVGSVVISGRHEITKPMRRTRSIGQDIEGQIPGTKITLYRAVLDTLNFKYASAAF